MDGGDEGRLTDADVPQPYVPTRGRRAAARRAAAEEEEKRALEGGNENEEAPPAPRAMETEWDVQGGPGGPGEGSSAGGPSSSTVAKIRELEEVSDSDMFGKAGGVGPVAQQQEDVYVIPDLEEEAGEDLTRQVAEAPDFRQNRVVALDVLEQGGRRSARALSSGQDISLQLLERSLLPEHLLEEPDVVWNYGQLFSEVAQQVHEEMDSKPDEDLEMGVVKGVERAVKAVSSVGGQ